MAVADHIVLQGIFHQQLHADRHHLGRKVFRLDVLVNQQVVAIAYLHHGDKIVGEAHLVRQRH